MPDTQTQEPQVMSVLDSLQERSLSLVIDGPSAAEKKSLIDEAMDAAVEKSARMVLAQRKAEMQAAINITAAIGGDAAMESQRLAIKLLKLQLKRK